MAEWRTGDVQVRGARERNLKDIAIDIPRDAIVAFTGVSGSGKSSLAFGTLYAEAQRRYLDAVSPHARRLIEQIGAPDVDLITGLPPAVALQQQRGIPSARSTVGSLTGLSNLSRLLFSRAGSYPVGAARLDANGFSPDSTDGACARCHGLGHVHDVTERSLVPDDSLTIRQRAIAAWPPAWHGQNLRETLVSLGFDVDRPWRELSRTERDWILFSDEQPVVPVYPGLEPAAMRNAILERRPGSYQGTFSSARRYVLQTYATTTSASIRRRVLKYMVQRPCSACDGRRLRPEALEVKCRGVDINALSRMPLSEAKRLLAQEDAGLPEGSALRPVGHREAERAILQDLMPRIDALTALGLGFLSMDRATDTLSAGEHQRLRLASQIKSNLFGVVYVLDEPSAGLHPADTANLLGALDRLRLTGNSVFVVEHDLAVVRHADWVVDIGPGAGQHGGQVLYSGPVAGLTDVGASATGQWLAGRSHLPQRQARELKHWLGLVEVSCNNVRGLDVEFPLGVFTTVTGVSGAGKSSLVSRGLVEIVSRALGIEAPANDPDDVSESPLLNRRCTECAGKLSFGMESLDRIVYVDHRPIGRTPRSNLATYTGLFDPIRTLFAQTAAAKERGFDASHFSFNVAAGRCATCSGEGYVVVELLFLPSTYAPCPACGGKRYSSDTLSVVWRGMHVAEVLELTVDDADAVFVDQPRIQRSLQALRAVGLGYLRLGQPATQLSGGEAQRIKLATELQRTARGRTLYVLDEPTNGLHPADVSLLLNELHRLVSLGHTVVVVENDMGVAASGDWVIEMGPGAGEAGGRIVSTGRPQQVADLGAGASARYLALALEQPRVEVP